MGAEAAQPLSGRVWDGIFRRQVGVTVRSLDDETRAFEVVASTDSLDSHGDVVEQTFDLSRYKKNPVVLWLHNSFGFLDGSRAEDFLPVGMAPRTKISGGKLESKIELVPGTDAEEPLVSKIWRRVKHGSLRAVSIGFRPGLIHEEDTGSGTIYHLDENDLYEISVVPIPSNPDAVAKAVAREHDWIKAQNFEERRWTRSSSKGRTPSSYSLPPVGADRHEVIKGAVPFYDYPPNESPWDASKALERVREWAGGEDTNWSKYSEAFAWSDTANPESFDSYKLLHHDVLNGGLVTVKDGVTSAGNAVQGARGASGIPSEDVPGVKRHLEKHYAQFDLTAPWHKSEDTSAGKDGPQTNEKNTMTDEEKAELLKLKTELNTANAQKAIADERLKLAEDTAKAATARVTTLESELATEKTVSTRLTTELKSAGDRAVKAESELCASVIESFVGTKLVPAEKAGMVELALGVKNADGSVKDAGIGLERVKSMIAARPDLALLTPVVNKDGTPVGGSAPTAVADEVENASADLAAAATKSADARAN